MSEQPIDPVQRGKGRRQLIFIATLFFGPALVAWVWFSNLDLFGRPDSTVNHGQLLQHGHELEMPELSFLDGGKVSADEFRGKWTLLYIGAESCDEACRQVLYHTRQVRLLLNQNMARVQRVLVLSQPAEASFKAVLPEHQGLKVINGDDAAGASLLQQFEALENHAFQLGDHFYMIDPLGKVMMIYNWNVEPKGLLKDLKRLMKINQSG